MHADLVGRPAGSAAPDESWLAAALDRVFPAEGYDEQRAAARVALTHATTVLTGGPGTGKTTTVAALLALCAEQAELRAVPRSASPWPRPPARRPPGSSRRSRRRWPSCRAADRARLAGVRAVTLHRLLGAAAGHVVPVPAPPRQPAATRRRGGRRDLDGVADDDGPAARGGPARQPADPGRRPVPARVGRGRRGAGRPGRRRAGEDPGRRRRAASPRTASASRSARSPRPSAAATPTRPSRCSRPAATTSSWSTSTTPRAAVRALVAPHALGVLRRGRGRRRRPRPGLLDAEAAAVRAPRGPLRRTPLERARSSAGSARRPANRSGRPGTPAGRSSSPPTTTASASTTATPASPSARRSAAGRALRAAIAGSAGRLDLATSRLGQVETMHALTIHKSQGSQADEVVVILPPPESRLLTRELFYTAITRARERVVVVGSPDDVRAAIDRRALRATGLRQRLAGAVRTLSHRKPPRHRASPSVGECHSSSASSCPTSPGRWAGSRPRSVRRAATSRRSRSSRSATAPRSTTCSSRCTAARCPTPWCPPATCSTASGSCGSAATPRAATSSSTSRSSRS